MKKLYILLATIVLASCDGSDSNNSGESQSQEVIEGSCHYIRLLASPIRETSSVDASALGYVCTSGAFKDHKSSESWCKDVGKVYDKEGKLLKFTPNGTCTTDNAAAVCTNSKVSSKTPTIALYDKEPYDTAEAKKGLQDLCKYYGMTYTEK